MVASYVQYITFSLLHFCGNGARKGKMTFSSPFCFYRSESKLNSNVLQCCDNFENGKKKVNIMVQFLVEINFPSKFYIYTHTLTYQYMRNITIKNFL
jgi:hypothetical protein